MTFPVLKECLVARFKGHFYPLAGWVAEEMSDGIDNGQVGAPEHLCARLSLGQLLLGQARGLWTD